MRDEQLACRWDPLVLPLLRADRTRGRTDDGIWDRLVRDYVPQNFRVEHISNGAFAGCAVTGRMQ